MIKKLTYLFLFLLIILTSCVDQTMTNLVVDIVDENINIRIDETYDINYEISSNDYEIIWEYDNSIIEINNGVIMPKSVGETTITLIVGDTSDSVVVTIYDYTRYNVVYMVDDTIYYEDNIISGNPLDYPDNPIKDGYIFSHWSLSVDGNNISQNYLVNEDLVLYAVFIDEEGNEDPYIGIDVDEFYNNYTPASSYLDSYYRSLHNLMSGDITMPSQEPTYASNRPMSDGMYLRNTDANYSDNGNTYNVVDCNNNVVLTIYRGGAYISLDEVAAYLLAFGDVPANYVTSKSTSPSKSPWGEYLRLNHTYFSGDTSRYPYEPLLPDISGEGGNLDYYEIDFGTTGTDCDPRYDTVIYNDGTKITRGAARLVYTRYDENGNNIIDINEKYVFYTYNHYNDFEEYLNYYGGWGEMFGNITGGGEISSKYNYNPTPYVETKRVSFNSFFGV